MPIYKYKCPTCGIIKEFLHDYDEPAPLCPVCCWNPECQGKDEIMVRIVSKTGPPKFKGKGFYETDYKGKK